ncbi:hypothetical protein ACP70R_043736 [Stipagrostis hirtigluma subsp. patula]
MHKEEEDEEEKGEHKAPFMTTPSLACRRRHSSSSASSSSHSTTTQEAAEEEDMANALILLAQQGAAAVEAPDQHPKPARSERYTSRRYAEAAATPDGGKAGFYVYECRTCGRCFPSFQALGGHRTSHKKPRLAAGDHDHGYGGAKNKNGPAAEDMTALSLRTGGGGVKAAAHACSTCGAVFASGQALGGHMRRHRPLLHAAPESVVTVEGNGDKQERSINLEKLDLNLPAPSWTDQEVTSPAKPAPRMGAFHAS